MLTEAGEKPAQCLSRAGCGSKKVPVIIRPPLAPEGSLCTLPTLKSFVIDDNDGHPFIWESFSTNRALAKLFLSFAFQSLVKSSLPPFR